MAADMKLLKGLGKKSAMGYVASINPVAGAALMAGSAISGKRKKSKKQQQEQEYEHPYDGTGTGHA